MSQLSVSIEFFNGDIYGSSKMIFDIPMNSKSVLEDIISDCHSRDKVLSVWTTYETQVNDEYAMAQCNLHFVTKRDIINSAYEKVGTLPNGVFLWPYIVPDDFHTKWPGWTLTNPHWNEYSSKLRVWVYTGQDVDLPLQSIVTEQEGFTILKRFLDLISESDFNPREGVFTTVLQNYEWNIAE